MKVPVSMNNFKNGLMYFFAALAISFLLYQCESLSLGWSICIGFGASVLSIINSK